MGCHPVALHIHTQTIHRTIQIIIELKKLNITVSTCHVTDITGLLHLISDTCRPQSEVLFRSLKCTDKNKAGFYRVCIKSFLTICTAH
jgi:hypothetical protein